MLGEKERLILRDLEKLIMFGKMEKRLIAQNLENRRKVGETEKLKNGLLNEIDLMQKI
jgi:hypothetical protein